MLDKLKADMMTAVEKMPDNWGETELNYAAGAGRPLVRGMSARQRAAGCPVTGEARQWTIRLGSRRRLYCGTWCL
jgi:hypothetical protein